MLEIQVWIFQSLCLNIPKVAVGPIEFGAIADLGSINNSISTGVAVRCIEGETVRATNQEAGSVVGLAQTAGMSVLVTITDLVSLQAPVTTGVTSGTIDTQAI